MSQSFSLRPAVKALQFFSQTRVTCRQASTRRKQARPQHRGAATSVQNVGQNHYTPLSASQIVQDSSIEPTTSSRVAGLEDARPFSEFLTDTYDRQHTYLRISITERCNLRCLYCMPEEGVPLSPQSHLMTPQEINYLSALFVSQGVTKIRLTGGEPTVHPQILEIISQLGRLRSHGLEELCLTTNGLTLARKLDSMIESGVTGINLSLDTLDPAQFELMTRRRGFHAVMKSIDQILAMKRSGGASNLKLKINVVIMRNVNDAQLVRFVEMTRDKNLEVRFIEYMPFSGNAWAERKMLGYQEMLAIIREQYPEIAPVPDEDHPKDTSKTFHVPGFAGRIGFITSMTEHFCGTCNRLRITSDGNLKVCLFGNAEVSLRDVIRTSFNDGNPIDAQALDAIRELESRRTGGILGTGDTLDGQQIHLREKEQELLDVIGKAVKRKKARHAGLGKLEHMENRPMILIDEPITFPTTRYLSMPFSARSPSRRRQILSPLPFLPYSSTPSFLGARAYGTKSAETGNGPPSLTHLTASGAARMVTLPSPTQDFTPTAGPTANYKPPTHRIAIAHAYIRFSNAIPIQQIHAAQLKKGDVGAVARVAGIMAAKRTSELIPLCHNIPISGVRIGLEVVEAKNANSSESNTVNGIEAREEGLALHLSADSCGEFGGMRIAARVETFGQTGVEMEALTAANVAALTVYDMCKAVDKGMRIDGCRVVLKEGGKSGIWKEGSASSH